MARALGLTVALGCLAAPVCAQTVAAGRTSRGSGMSPCPRSRGASTTNEWMPRVANARTGEALAIADDTLSVALPRESFVLLGFAEDYRG